MNTPQVIEAASTVEQKSDSDFSLQWLMAEVDMYASQLEDAADELEETLGRFEDEEDSIPDAVLEAAEDAKSRVFNCIFEIDRELDRLRSAHEKACEEAEDLPDPSRRPGGAAMRGASLLSLGGYGKWECT